MFHLNDKEAKKDTSVYFCGEIIEKIRKLPVYLGITFDRTLTYKTHLYKLTEKLKSKIGLINKLPICKMGSFNMCSTPTVALDYSVAQYCIPV